MAQEDAEILMEQADVGLVPHVNLLTRFNYASKLFQYMYLKLLYCSNYAFYVLEN